MRDGRRNELDAGDGRGAEQSSPADDAVRALAPYSAAAAVPMEFSISHRRPIRKRSTCERLVSPRRCGVRSVDQAQGRRETVRTLRRLLRLGHVFCGKHTRRAYAPPRQPSSRRLARATALCPVRPAIKPMVSRARIQQRRTAVTTLAT